MRIIHNYDIISLLLVLYFFFAGVQDQAVSASCIAPVITNYSDRTLESIRVNWLNVYQNDAWEIELVEKGEVFNGVPTTALILTGFYEFSALDPNTNYCFKIRGVCGGDPGPWSPAYCFFTGLSFPGMCGLNFQLKDPTVNQAFEDNEFYVYNEMFPNGQLGIDVFIQDVELIIAHNWPADLEITLTSPSGKQVILSNREGFNSNHYGVPGTAFCDSVALFSDEACLSVEGHIPLVGEFQPEESFSTLYDNSSAFGNWKLNIRDHNSGHAGILQFFQINLVELACRLPEIIYVEPEGPNSASLNWFEEQHLSDSLVLEFGLSGFTPGTGATRVIAADGNTFPFQGLSPSTSYDVYVRAKCAEDLSVMSCPFTFETSCLPISMKESFDALTDCNNDCNSSCFLSDNWKNAPFPFQKWLVNQGETSTDNTGPSHDVPGFGKYIYVESSESDCGFDSLAILESRCLEIASGGTSCDLSFYYFMYGADVGQLKLQITVDDGANWTTLFEKNGDQGNSWLKEIIDLDTYANKVGRFRFVAGLNRGGQTERGDIALDEIVFYGTAPVVEAQYLFYVDNDGDNYGEMSTGGFFCSNNIIEGYSRNNLDCDDENPGINPGSAEVPCNSIDENCNGQTDDLELENPLIIEVQEIISEYCKGSQDGSITIKVSGGEGPYTFSWSDGSTDSLLTGVGAGYYQCEVKDQLGCLAISESIELPFDSPIEFVLVDKSIVSCQGATDGEISIDQIGGVEPFSYVWSNGADTKNIQGLSPGIYSVTIVDSLGCILESPEIKLTASTQFTLGLELTEPSCFGLNNGAIEVIGVQNGLPPFSYEWSTGDTIPQIADLVSGYYSLTVSDASFCYGVFDSIWIGEPDQLLANVIAKDDVSCYGDSDGSIELNAYGGTVPYTFHWTKDNAIFSNTDDLFNLEAASYQITVRDKNACEFVSDELIITQPNAITIEIDTIVHAECSKSEDGYIEISAYGGSGDYHFFWNGLQEGDTSFVNLNPGFYSVVVTDRYGCKGFRNGIELNQLDKPVQIDINLLESIKCYGDSSAVLSAQAEAAALPLDFNWSAGIKRIKEFSSDTLMKIYPGIYNVTVTDADGCVGVSEWVDIVQPDQLLYNIYEIQEVACAGDYTGIIDISLFGGTKPYSIVWSNGKKTDRIIHLPSAFYTAVVTDENGCEMAIDSIYMHEPEAITVKVMSTPAVYGQFNGTASVIPEGGVTPYAYSWDEHAAFQTQQTAYNLDPGEYFVTVTDYNDCDKEALVIVPFLDAVVDQSASNINVYPNPASEFIIVKIPELISGDFELKLYDIYGNKIANYRIETQNALLLKLDVSELAAGAYLLNLLSDSGNYVQRILVIR